MAIDDLRARLDRLLAEFGRVGDTRQAAAGIYDAMVDTKAAIGMTRDALVATERELTVERQRLEDAERRGRLADGIQDTETAELARIWTTKHRERVDLLERKRLVQLDELAYAERQLAEMAEHYKRARAGVASGAAAPAPDPELERLGHEMDSQARAAKVQEQLADLKRKLGRQD